MRLSSIVAATGILLASFTAHADVFSFSVPLTSGPATGTLTGTVDLAFITNGGSGSGAASSVILTSIPAGFGSLSGGDDVTSYTNQIANSFTVVGGDVTSDLFFASTTGDSSGDVLCLNSTGANSTFSALDCQSQLNELNGDAGEFGYNFLGLAGITFTDTSVAATPEPSSIGLLLTGVLGMGGLIRRRRA